jgi:hypothetical protein
MGEGSVVGERGAGSADGRVDSGFLGKPPRQKGPAEDIWASFCPLQQAFGHHSQTRVAPLAGVQPMVMVEKLQLHRLSWWHCQSPSPLTSKRLRSSLTECSTALTSS